MQASSSNTLAAAVGAEIGLDRLPSLLRAALATGAPIVLLGAPGCGKTAAATAAADALGVGCVVLNAASALPLDVIGLPVVRQSGDAGEGVVYAEPTWLRELRATGRHRGILVLDEVATAPAETAPVFAQLLGERRAGAFRLPEGWVVLALGNRPQDRAGARPMLAHIINRAAVYTVRPDLKSWLAWAKTVSGRPLPEGLPPLAVAFARTGEFAPWIDKMSPRGANEPWLSWRSYTLAWRTVAALRLDDPTTPLVDVRIDPDPAVRDAFASFLPPEIVELVSEYLLVGAQVPTLQQVLEDPDNAIVPDTVRGGLAAIEAIAAQAMAWEPKLRKGETIERHAHDARERLVRWLKRAPGVVRSEIAERLLGSTFAAKVPPIMRGIGARELFSPLWSEGRGFSVDGEDL